MADDSVSPPPVADSTPSAPLSPSDQTSPPVDIGQQPDSTWPNSTNLANNPSSADSNLANPTPPTSEPVVSADSPIPSIPSITPTEPVYSLPAEPPLPPSSPLSPPSPLSPISSQTDQLSFRRQKANQVRSQKKTNHLNKIMELAKNAKSISNTDVQRLLHVSQSTATNYLSELSRKGLLKKQGIRGGAKYTL